MHTVAIYSKKSIHIHSLCVLVFTYAITNSLQYTRTDSKDFKVHKYQVYKVITYMINLCKIKSYSA